MGAKFSKTTLKVKLSTAKTRMSQRLNKLNNALRTERRQIATLLNEDKSEKARIRAEFLFNQMGMIQTLELLSLMVELMLARLNLIAAERSCPGELLEAVASTIYCAKRVDIKELQEIAHLLAAHWGEEWVKTHVNNQSQRVHIKIVKALSTDPPSYEKVIELLKDCAKEFEVAWQCDLEREDEEKGDPNDSYRIGSVLKNLPSSSASGYSTDLTFPTGILTLSVHAARRLYVPSMFGIMDPYVTLSLSKQAGAPKHKTATIRDGGSNVEFDNEHFPFTIKESGLRIRVEVYTAGKVSDTFVGRCYLEVDRLIRTPDTLWYRLGRDLNETTDAGEIRLTTKYTPIEEEKTDMQRFHEQVNGIQAVQYTASILNGGGGAAVSAPVLDGYGANSDGKIRDPPPPFDDADPNFTPGEVRQVDDTNDDVHDTANQDDDDEDDDLERRFNDLHKR